MNGNMKKYLTIMTVALAAAACDSNKMDIIAPDAPGREICAVLEGATRTSIVDPAADVLKLQWQDAEEFAMYDGVSVLKYSRTTGDQFVSEDVPAQAADYYGYYPYSAVTGTSAGGFKVEFPSVQHFVKDNLEDNAFPMVGKWVDGHMSFKNLASLLVFNLRAEGPQDGICVESVEIRADRNISGPAAVAFGSKELVMAEGGSTAIIVECAGVSLSSTDVTSFHAMVPPGKYGTLEVTVRTSDHRVFGYTVEGGIDAERSMAYTADLGSVGFTADDSALQAILEKQIADGCSPYVASVVDVDFAPGQFINTLPSGLGTKESAKANCAVSLVGVKPTGSNYVHLGGWGGSITVGFDHPILNMSGADFRGYGNAFGGSSEPGVYYVAQKDGEGNPDRWYLIRHAMYDYAIHDYEITYSRPEREQAVQKTAYYWKGDYGTTVQAIVKTVWTNKSKAVVIPSLDEGVEWKLYNGYIYKDTGTGTATIFKCVKANTVTVSVTSDDVPQTYTEDGVAYPLAYVSTTTADAFSDYIYWEDNLGHSGYENKNSFHKQSYWPEYAGEKIVIRGEYLPVNSFNEGGTWVQDAKYWGFPTGGVDPSYSDPLDAGKSLGIGAYGYCDNYPNAHSLSCIDIDWAVDENGDFVHLDHIDFIKVQTATHRQTPMTGENSTEFCGVVDLHITGETVVPYTGIVPDLNNIYKSGAADQPETGLLYWSY